VVSEPKVSGDPGRLSAALPGSTAQRFDQQSHSCGITQLLIFAVLEIQSIKMGQFWSAFRVPPFGDPSAAVGIVASLIIAL
jgi:hypothetical protein